MNARRLLFALVLLLGCGTPRLFSATYTVNSTEDRPDADPLDGVCSATATGACTLRAAIMEANVASGADKITLPAGTYQITRALVEDAALAGDLDITESVTIEGAGSGVTIVDGNGAVTNERVFHIRQSASAVSISGLTVRNGKQAPGFDGEGGGIRCHAFDTMLRDVIITDNGASEGGGVYVTGGGKLVLQNVSVQKNTGTNHGGGILAKDCVLELRNVSLHDNSANVRGGGLYATGVTLTITGSTVDQNKAFSGAGLDLRGLLASSVTKTAIFSNTATGNGGGVFVANGSPLSFTDCSVHHNVAAGSGGGIYNGAPLVLARSVIDSNSAQMSGGGIMIAKLEPLGSPVDVLIEQSTVTGNTAQFGAGIHYDEPTQPTHPRTLILRNSTIAHNTGSREGGGIYARAFANVSLQSVTIAANALFRPDAGSLRGGGVALVDTARALGHNTIVADNHAAIGSSSATPDDIYTAATTTFDLGSGSNFIETTTNCNFSGTTSGNIFGQDPKFDPAGVADHGGPTPTLALLPTSPAINAGMNAGAPGGDQRGRMRVGVVDMGAFESDGIQPRIISIAPSGNDVVVRFEAVATRTFRLERKSALTSGTWAKIAGVNDLTVWVNGAAEIRDPGAVALGKAYYRVRLLP